MRHGRVAKDKEDDFLKFRRWMNQKILQVAFIFALPVWLLVDLTSSVFAQMADYVLTNSKVYTVNEAQPWAEAVAVKGKSIVYVGNNEGARKLIGNNTTVADLRGKLMLPGLISTHEHSIATMGLSSGLMFKETLNDKDKMLAVVKEYLTTNPKGPFFSFGGGYEGVVEIHRKDIDNIVSDHPFVMMAGTGHGGWANSMALKMAGVVKGKADPIDSFGRDNDGIPNGYVGSAAAIQYMFKALNLLTKETVLSGSAGILKYIARSGVTGMFEAGQPPGSEEPLFSAIEELERQGKLTVRFTVSCKAQRAQHIEIALECLRTFGPKYSSEFFNVNTLKVHGDGAFEGRTAGLLEPYSDMPDTRGLVAMKPEKLSYVMVEAAKMGYDIHTHAIGDWANRAMLDGMEAVRKAGYGETRLSMGHTVLVSDEDMPRFKSLSVTANFYGMEVAAPNPVYLKRLGKKRYVKLMRLKSLVNDGVRVTLSADYPTLPLDPFRQMAAVMTRSKPGEKDFLAPVSERLTLEDAIRAYTINAAYQVRMEKIVGSLEVGKRADLIVVDRDLFKATADELAETNVLATMVNGRVVHEEAIDWSSSETTVRIDMTGMSP